MYYAESEKGQEQYQRYMKSYGPMLMSMAERLGFSSLAAEMAQVLRIVSTQSFKPWIRSKHQVAYIVVPKSYRERFSVRSWRKLSGAFQLGLKTLRRVKRLCGRVFRFMQNVTKAPSRSHDPSGIEGKAMYSYAQTKSNSLTSFGSRATQGRTSILCAMPMNWRWSFLAAVFSRRESPSSLTS